MQKLAKRKSDPRLYADELGKGFIGELDYTLEAANASKFQVINDVSICVWSFLQLQILMIPSNRSL